MPTSKAREQLILAGERLFAVHGIEAVSLRQLNDAAGQRNKSAVHYHFGSKQALVEAIFAFRIPAMDARRGELLDAIDASPKATTLRDWIAVFVLPLSQSTDVESGEAHYLRFLSQIFGNPQEWLVGALRTRRDESLARTLEAIRECIVHLPARLASHRVAEMIGMVIHALADHESQCHGGGHRIDGEATLPKALFVEDLIDRAVAMLMAPASRATLAALESNTTLEDRRMIA